MSRSCLAACFALALVWASGISGWDSAEPKPLFLYDPRAEL